MVMSETAGTKCNSTTFSASRRAVQRARPLGAGEQASAHEALFEMLDGAGGNTQGGGHIRDFPGFLGLGADVAQQGRAGVNEFWSGGFAAAGGVAQLLAFFLSEGDPISICQTHF